MLQIAFLFLVQFGTCVYSFITEAVCFTFKLPIVCMFEYPVTYHVISYVASYKLHKLLETRIKVHEEEKKVLITMNQELEGITVSVAYTHQGCSIIRSYCFGMPEDHLNVHFQPAVVHLA